MDKKAFPPPKTMDIAPCLYSDVSFLISSSTYMLTYNMPREKVLHWMIHEKKQSWQSFLFFLLFFPQNMEWWSISYGPKEIFMLLMIWYTWLVNLQLTFFMLCNPILSPQYSNHTETCESIIIWVWSLPQYQLIAV